VYLKQKLQSEFLLTYGEEFIRKPTSSYDFLVIGKISDQLSHLNFFKKYDPKVIICLDGPLPLSTKVKNKTKKILEYFC
jgi:hypothetical protein